MALFSAGFAGMLAAGWSGFPRLLYASRPQPLQFNHKIHMEKGALACDGCHSFRPDGTFTGVPRVEICAPCHSAPVGKTDAEKIVVERYVTPNREIPWEIYSRQPVNVRFAHSHHVRKAKLACETCHGDHGKTERVRDYQVNRVSGYSRDIWGPTMSRLGRRPGQGMKMDDCERCHQQKGIVVGCLGCHQ